MIVKPTVADLGIDPEAQHWQRSGDGAGALEIAFVKLPDPPTPPASASPASASASASLAPPASAPPAPAATPSTLAPTAPAGTGDWVLMRVSDDPEGRVLVFDRHEWECFLDGARNGEFDDAAGSVAN